MKACVKFLYCGCAMLLLSSSVSAGPVRVESEFMVLDSLLGISELVSLNTLLREHDVQELEFKYCPWEHTVDNLDLIRDAYDFRGVASRLVERSDPSLEPMDPGSDWWWLDGAEFDPTPTPMTPDDWAKWTPRPWGPDPPGPGPWPGPDPGPGPEPDPWPWPGPRPVCPECSHFDVLETISVFGSENSLDRAFMRTALVFETGMLESLSQDAYATIEGFRADGILIEGYLEMLVYNPGVQDFESVMTAQVDAYSLTVGGPGDINVDGQVTGGDLLALQRGLGQRFTAGDLNIWSDNFGSGNLAAASLTNVPEPTILLLLATGATALAGIRVRTAISLPRQLS